MHKPVLPIVALVVLALLLGLPPVLGMLTESQVNARVAAMADDALLTARVDSYERGWFGSRARIELALGRDYASRLQSLGTSTEASPRSAMILVDFAHGPIAIRDGAQLGLSTMVARIDPDSAGHRELLTRLGVPYLFEFRGRTGFLGRLTFEADAPPLDLAADDAAVLFSGALLEGSFGGGALDYAARVDVFDLRSGDAAFTARGLAAEGRNEVRAFLPLGPATFTLERLTIDDAGAQGAPALDATSLRFTTDLRLDEDGVLISGEQTLAAESVSVAPVTVRDVGATFGYRDLDADALTAYARALQRGAAVGNVDPYLLLTEVTPSIERLLAAGPSLLVEPLRFTVNGEPFDGRFRLNVRPEAMPPAGALDLRDLGLWADVLQLTAEATVSKVLARSVAVQLTAAQLAAGGAVPPSQIEAMAEAQVGLILLTLIGQGLVTDDGETYTLRLDLTDGTLSVNGVPLPFGVP
jgi:uncharacterized protein YdgA (DUF945 family)